MNRCKEKHGTCRRMTKRIFCAVLPLFFIFAGCAGIQQPLMTKHDKSRAMRAKARFAGYVHLVENEIRKKVTRRLDEEGGIPNGDHQVVTRVTVDGSGSVTGCEVVGSSGNQKIDNAVMESVVKVSRISEPPPEGMPSTMVIRIRITQLERAR